MKNLIVLIATLFLSVSSVSAQAKGLGGYEKDKTPMIDDLSDINNRYYVIDINNDTTYFFYSYNDYYGVNDVLLEAQRVLNENDVALGIDIAQVREDYENGINVDIYKEYRFGGGFLAKVSIHSDEEECDFVLYREVY